VDSRSDGLHVNQIPGFLSGRSFEIKLDNVKVPGSALLATAPAGARIRSGVRLVILGPPNSGKSTLFNYLCGAERAIVSPHPGTTRDVVEAELDIGGVAVLIQDTAGLRDGGDAVEIEGHRRALAAAASADAALVLWGAESEDRPGDLPDNLPVIRLRSKIDLRPGLAADNGWIGISCHTGDGMSDLRRELLRTVLHDIPDLGGVVAISARHRRSVEVAAAELDACDVSQPETAAESIRWALHAVDELIGEVANEEVLDEIYGTFCIGK